MIDIEGPSEVTSNDAAECFDCVIVGAGVSGLVAAYELQERGVSNFLVVEGSDRIGGRLRSASLGDGTTIELGANWVQGACPENPIYDLAVNRLKLNGHVDEDAGVVVRSRGDPVPQQLHQIVRYKELQEALERVGAMSCELPTGQDDSLSSALSKSGWCPASDLDRVLQWWACDFEYAECPAKTSIHHNVAEEFTQEDFGEDNFLITDSRGFDQLANELCSRLDFGASNHRLRLGARVSSVEWDAKKGQRLEASGIDTSGKLTDVEQQGASKFPVSVLLSRNRDEIIQNGGILNEQIRCRCVLLTVSFGVLQAGLIGFSPALPDWKLNQINQISMAIYVKVFVRWETPWWDHPQTRSQGDAAPAQPIESDIVHVLLAGSTWPLVSKVSNCLCFTVVGDEGRRVEKLSPQELEDEIMDVLGNYFPESDIPRPAEIKVPRWGADPLFHGAYSFLPVGSFPEGMDGLQEPVGDGAMWFAGEACHARYSGYLQGAYMSGREVGERIAAFLKPETKC